MEGMKTLLPYAFPFLMLACAYSARADVYNMPSGQTSLQFVTVGNPGNSPDPTVMTDSTSGYGSVSYTYQIGKYDVTNAQYVQFLNAKAVGGDPLGLYNSGMSDPNYGGIKYNGSTYSVIAGNGNHPVNYISWYDAIRFANWLNNGQGSGDTESGAYLLQGGTPTPSNANSIMRQSGATVFLPSENEWYKAAYYNPAMGLYYQYPTSNNTVPAATSPTATPNSANFNFVVGNLTDVGAYNGTTSPYGAYDMAGNVYQWNEALINNTNRGPRGGSFGGAPITLKSSVRANSLPSGEDFVIGFRVAAVPEPSTFVLAVLAIIGLIFRRRFA
jgi:formylglycine-generating enzyme